MRKNSSEMFNNTNEFEEWEGVWSYSEEEGQHTPQTDAKQQNRTKSTTDDLEEEKEDVQESVNTGGRRDWNRLVNRIVMECYYHSEAPRRGFRKRMFKIWNEIGPFEVNNEQQLAG